MNTEFDEFWLSLQKKSSESLNRLVPRGSEIIYLEYPVYSNIGDLLICLGTEQWFRRSGLTVLGRWNIFNFTFPKISDTVILLCQGGGNFGDMYPQQAFREAIVEAYPRNPIIFLPQTIHYRDNSNLEISKRKLNRHPSLKLLLRDHDSLNLAETHFPNAECQLAPDMSVWMYPLGESLDLPAHPSRRIKTLCLLRTDSERIQEQVLPQLTPDWEGDWSDLLGIRRIKLRVMKLSGRFFHSLIPPQSFASCWLSNASRTSSYCASRFMEAETIVSSRLHGHLLASMLGISNVVLDNSYGKNFRYFQTWHQDLKIATFFR